MFLISGEDSSVNDVAGRVQKVSEAGVLTDVGGTLHGSIRDLGGVDSAHLTGIGSALGNGQIYRFDGTAWTSSSVSLQQGGALRFPFSLYVPNANDVFLVAGAASAVAVHYAGTALGALDTTPFLGSVGGRLSHGVLFGYAANDVWAVGSGPLAQHWTGTSWQNVPVASSTSCQVGATFGAHRGVCFGDTLKQAIGFDGTSWAPIPEASALGDTVTQAVAQRGNVVVVLGARSGLFGPVLYAYDGSSFSSIAFPDDPTLQVDSVGVLANGRVAFTAYTVMAGHIDQVYLLLQSP